MVSRRLPGPRLTKLIPCGYCFEEWADCYDHIMPISRGGTNRKSNLYPACNRCNGLVCALLFETLEEKRDYIRQQLKQRGEWHGADQMQRVRETISSEATLASILLGRMQVEGMGPEPSENRGRCQWCGETKILVDGIYCKKCSKN